MNIGTQIWVLAAEVIPRTPPSAGDLANPMNKLLEVWGQTQLAGLILAAIFGVVAIIMYGAGKFSNHVGGQRRGISTFTVALVMAAAIGAIYWMVNYGFNFGSSFSSQ